VGRGRVIVICINCIGGTRHSRNERCGRTCVRTVVLSRGLLAIAPCRRFFTMNYQIRVRDCGKIVRHVYDSETPSSTRNFTILLLLLLFSVYYYNTTTTTTITINYYYYYYNTTLLLLVTTSTIL